VNYKVRQRHTVIISHNHIRFPRQSEIVCGSTTNCTDSDSYKVVDEAESRDLLGIFKIPNFVRYKVAQKLRKCLAVWPGAGMYSRVVVSSDGTLKLQFNTLLQ